VALGQKKAEAWKTLSAFIIIHHPNPLFKNVIHPNNPVSGCGRVHV